MEILLGMCAKPRHLHFSKLEQLALLADQEMEMEMAPPSGGGAEMLTHPSHP